MVSFSSMFEKHTDIVFPSNSLDDCSYWWFDGLWKSEGVFRLTSMEFSTMFFLLILSSIMVTITIIKMQKRLIIWKNNKDLKVKYTSLQICDAFLSEILTAIMKALLVLVT